MNDVFFWGGRERKLSQPTFKTPSWHLLGRIEKNHENTSVRTAGLTAKVHTQDLLNTK
jgi:hypothetical protein